MAGRRSVLGPVVLASLTLCALVALGAARSSASIIVDVPCTGPGGGTQGLIAAIQDANSHGGGQISLAPDCTYTITTGAFSNGHGPVGLPTIESSITMIGNGATIAREPGSGPAFRLMEISSVGNLAVNDATLTGGNAGTSGPAIPGGGAILVNHRATLLVTNSLLMGNTAADGGAISNLAGLVRITDSTLRRNHAADDPGATGGAINNGNGRVIINSSVLTHNDATTKGGAIQSPAGIVRVTRSTISDNRAFLNAAGGGIYTGGVGKPATLVLRRSTLSGNKAMGFGANGGAIANYANAELTVTDSTISNNSAGQPGLAGARGGAIINFGRGSVTSSTITGNRPIGPNGATGGIAADAQLTVTASIVAVNGQGNCRGQIRDGGFDLENGATCGFTDHAVKGNPHLGPLADNGGFTLTRALQPGSPALDVVPPGRSYCEGTVDQRGVKRPQGPKCDIGAFERKAPK
jgi:hypothetical protein